MQWHSHIFKHKWSVQMLFRVALYTYVSLIVSGWAALWVVWQSDNSNLTHKKYTLTRAGMLQSALSSSVSDFRCHATFLYPVALLTLVILWASTEWIRIKSFRSLVCFSTLSFLVSLWYIGSERKWQFPKVKRSTFHTLKVFFPVLHIEVCGLNY